MQFLKNKLLNNFFFDSPTHWQLGFQNPATPIMEGIIWLHNYIGLFLIIVIVVVFWFLFRSIYLFDEAHNPKVTEFNHDPIIETVWTIAPAFILVAIAIPSFSLLYSMEEAFTPAFTVKIIGHQWYWSYEFGDIYRADNLLEYVLCNPERSRLYYFKKGWFGRHIEIDLYKTNNKLKNSYYFIKRAREENDTFLHLRKHCLYFDRVLAKIVRTKYYPYFAFRPSKPVNTSLLADLADHRPIFYSLTTPPRFWFYHFLWWITTDEKKHYNYIIGESKLVPDTLLKQVHIARTDIKVTFYSAIKPITKAQVTLTDIKWIAPSLKFDSYMLNLDQLPQNGLRLLEVDNQLVLPVKTPIKLLVTSADVIHSWAVPSFGIKIDAIPGRINQVQLYIKRQGQFYGQCSELCGVNHGFMPISIKAVDYGTFLSWFLDKSNPKNIDDLANSDSHIVVRKELKNIKH